MNGAETVAAVRSLASRRLGAVRIGAAHNRAHRSVAFIDGERLEVPGARSEWLLEPAALVVHGAGRALLLLWDLDEALATTAVTARLVREVGERRADRLLERLEQDSASLVGAARRG